MLRKTIPTKTGVDATIWDLVRVEWNKNGDTIVALYGFIDEEHTSAVPIDTRVINLGGHAYWFLSDLYDKIVESRIVDEVETNEFAGATRV